MSIRWTDVESRRWQRMMEVPFVDLRAQHANFHGELDEACLAALAAATTSSERKCGRSRKSSRNIAAQACVGVDSGLSALELCLRVYGIGPGDEVITSSNTFIATAMAISATGATPILVDPCEDDFCLDPTLLAEAITPRTRAIIPVHLYGHPCQMDAIIHIALAARIRRHRRRRASAWCAVQRRRVRLDRGCGRVQLLPVKESWRRW